MTLQRWYCCVNAAKILNLIKTSADRTNAFPYLQIKSAEGARSAHRDRKRRKTYFHRLWIAWINAAAVHRQHGMLLSIDGQHEGAWSGTTLAQMASQSMSQFAVNS